ncbi:MAG TPA: FUSC family membrane protein, partial [Puia sp.]|nr:FUSC family membrane protein [Puia sp.]
VLSGGVWYTMLSLLLYSFRPYKLVQQALGDCIQATAGYLRIKADFYSPDVEYDKAYRQLLESQVGIHAKQDLVRELLFKSRNIVRESTHVGRVLMMIFLDIIDLFERIMTSQQDYRMLHRSFDNSELMLECRKLILDLAGELDDVGIAIMSGKASVEASGLPARIRQARIDLNRFREEHPGSEEAYIGLANILDSIEDLADRLHTLQGYTTYDRTLSKNFSTEIDVDEFVAHTEVDRKIIFDNLSFKANIFRHSLRVSIATIVGYIIASVLPYGHHEYWILLTVVVILKPAYSLSKRRNFERLTGTLCGALAGLIFLYFIRDDRALFVLMILFMIGTYVFIRTNYLIAVMFTTPYVLLLFHLLYPTNFRVILTDRVIDTVIGSVIAFLANLLIIPSWEHERISDFMTGALQANIDYFRDVAAAFVGRKATMQQYKLSRKQAFVALANLSDALSRMLSEPRSQQKSITEMHQFVVSNHMLTSHIATLAYYVDPLAGRYAADAAYEPVIDDIVFRLEQTVALLSDQPPLPRVPVNKEALRALNDRVNVLMERRKAGMNGAVSEDSEARRRLSEFKPIVDQFNFIGKVTTDLARISEPLHTALMASQQEVGINPLV